MRPSCSHHISSCSLKCSMMVGVILGRPFSHRFRRAKLPRARLPCPCQCLIAVCQHIHCFFPGSCIQTMFIVWTSARGSSRKPIKYSRFLVWISSPNNIPHSQGALSLGGRPAESIAVILPYIDPVLSRIRFKTHFSIPLRSLKEWKGVRSANM